jgi:hypothetical protein
VDRMGKNSSVGDGLPGPHTSAQPTPTDGDAPLLQILTS